MPPRKQKKRNKSKQPLNILGISLGNVLAFKFATLFKTNKLISVVPGSKLPECIWESVTTGKIAKNSGKGLKGYRKELSCFNPIDDLKKIKINCCEIYLGTSDKMIPFKRGLQFAKEAKKILKNTDIKVYKTCGHIETVLKFSNKFHNHLL
jgi:hypothetical protein